MQRIKSWRLRFTTFPVIRWITDMMTYCNLAVYSSRKWRNGLTQQIWLQIICTFNIWFQQFKCWDYLQPALILRNCQISCHSDFPGGAGRKHCNPSSGWPKNAGDPAELRCPAHSTIVSRYNQSIVLKNQIEAIKSVLLHGSSSIIKRLSKARKIKGLAH